MRDKLKKAAEYYDSEDLNEIWEKMKNVLATVAREVKETGTANLATMLPFLQRADLLKWTESLTAAAATAYDKAMDAEYLRTRIGGPEHRLFDGGHTIWGSWQVSQEVAEREGDSLTQQIMGWAEAYMKDFTTTMGMPFVTVDKGDFDEWVKAIAGKVPGIDRSYFYDLLSFDAMEICAAGLSVVGVFFAFKKDDKEKLAEMLGAMGISSLISANPLMGLSVITVTAYSYWKHGRIEVASVLKGGGVTAVSAAMFSVMGLPILVELVIVVVLTTLLKKHIMNNDELIEWLKIKIHDSLQVPKALLNLESLASLLPRPIVP